ncbi:hypothetical protein [Paenibacillus sp. MSJ-34]|uniref:hypothetical protein n=1 Tax=Paenibacillus sp. MSJ-34 TaxID=2841529 RepID=UPI001C128E33|nr:hypothetical protein [Paenibacillus sp. MSJ-34]MBU5442048.1 hypothetical protein [Paenibacillus sp. MSJ-34]
MHETLKKQMDETSSVIRKLIDNIDFSTPENIVIATAAQESVLDALGDMLEERKRQYVEELNRIVMEYSAKIAATDNLLRTIGKEVGRREVLRERIEAGEPT